MTDVTVDKLAAHGITPDEVRQVNDGDRIVIANPRPRVPGSVLLIGPTNGGRVLTVVLNPDELDDDLACPHRMAVEQRTDSPLPPRPIEEHDVAMQHDDEITSAELDQLLSGAETIDAPRPDSGTDVRLYVSVDADTLHELEQRAASRGADLNDVAADALRAGVRAA